MMYLTLYCSANKELVSKAVTPRSLFRLSASPMHLRPCHSLEDQVDADAHVGQRAGDHLLVSLRQTASPAAPRLLRAPLEEVVLQGVVWRYPSLRVVLQHPKYKILEPKIVRHTVTRFTVAPSSRSSGFHAEDVVDLPRTSAAVFLTVFADIENVGTIGELVKVFLCLW